MQTTPRIHRLLLPLVAGSAVLCLAGAARAQSDPAPAQPPAAPAAVPAPAQPAPAQPAPGPAPVAPVAESTPAGLLGPAAAPRPAADSAPRPAQDFTAEDAERARFSGGRLVVGILGSAVGGSLAAYGTYKGVCGDEPCIGGALAGLGVNMVVTPVLSYGIGRLMGGRGTFSTTLLGALLGFGVGAPFMNQGNVGLAVGVICMPILGPLAFEFSSNGKAQEMKALLGNLELQPYVAPAGWGRSSAITWNRTPATTTFGLTGIF